MFSKVIFVLGFVCLTVLPVVLTSPTMEDGYSVFNHDLTSLTGDWYGSATSPGNYAFEKRFKGSDYRCKCIHNNFRAVGDYRLNVTMTCDLHNGVNFIGQATVTGYFDLFDYTTGLYAFWYRKDEEYYTTKDEPHTRHKITGIYDYYKDGAYYYAVPSDNNSTYSEGFIEFTTHETVMSTSLYTREYLDSSTLDKVIKKLSNYNVTLVKIDTSSCR